MSPPTRTAGIGVGIGAGINGHGKALLEGSDSGGFPPPDNGVDGRIDLVGKLLAAADREIVDNAGDEALVSVEVGASVVRFRVVVVEEAIPSLPSAPAAAAVDLLSRLLDHV